MTHLEEIALAEMPCEIIKARYEGDKAQYVQALADQGIGYVILEKGDDRGKKYIIAASHRPLKNPQPIHVSNLTNYEQDKAEKAFYNRITIDKKLQQA